MYAAPNDGVHAAYVTWLGNNILSKHALPTSFGAESFSSSGVHFIATGWLGAVLVASIARVAPTFEKTLEVSCCVATLALIAFRAVETSDRASRVVAGIIASVVATLLVAEPGRQGGELAPWLLGAALAALPITASAAGSLVFVFAISALWANVSTLGILSPIVVLLVQFSDGAKGRRIVFLTLASALGTLVNPAGYQLFVQAPANLELDRALMLLAPAWPSVTYHATYVFGLPILVAVAAFAAWSRRASTAEALAIAVCIVQLFASGRYFPFVAIVMVPITARAFAGVLEARATPLFATSIAYVFVIACSITFVAERRVVDPVFVSEDRAMHLAYDLNAMPGRHRVFCMNGPRYCDVFLPYAPRISSYIDERVGAYPERVRTVAFSVLRGDLAWRNLLDRYRINALLITSDSPLIPIALAGHWAVTSTSDDMTLLTRG